MATFRKVHTSFWGDPYIQSLSPEQKYFYLYLLTNERTKQCGIYEITKKQVSNDTGYNVETVTILINLFASHGKLKYNEDTYEVAIRNWSKYNDQTSPKVKACIHKELLNIKDPVLIEYCGYDVPEGVIINSNYRVGELLRKKVFDSHNHKCQKCGSAQNISVDHIIPRAIGGKSVEENLRCLCRSCNSSRPNIGRELVEEIISSGYDFDYLYTLNTGLDAYEYSIGRQSQEEKEKEQEEYNKKRAELLSQKNEEEMIVIEMVKVWKNAYYDYQFDKNLDYPSCLQLAYKIARAKGWRECDVIRFKEHETVESWKKIVDFVKEDSFYRNLSLIQLEKQWQGLHKKMNENQKAKNTTYGSSSNKQGNKSNMHDALAGF